MKPKCLLFFLLCLLFIGARALADVLILPGGIISVETEAFAGTGFDTLVVPAGVTELASNAFSSAIRTVYGLIDSVSQRYAQDVFAEFVPIDIDISELTGASWTVPDKEFQLGAVAISPFWPLSTRVDIERDGEVVYSADWVEGASCKAVMTESGTFDVRVFVRSKWTQSERLFPSSLTVAEPVKFISNPLRVNVGETVPALSFDETRPVTLKSSNSALMKVSGSDIRGIAAGTCKLTATAVEPEGTVTTVVPVQVCIKVASVTLSGAPQQLLIDRQAQLKAKVSPASATFPLVTWSSSDESVLTVSETGVITGISRGTATVTATADGVSSSVDVQVIVPVHDIDVRMVDPSETLYTAGNIALTFSVRPEYAENQAMVWSSSDTKLATVDASGVVTGLRAGDVTITCTAADGGGASASIPLTVVQGVTSISLKAPQSALFAEQSLTVAATVLPANAQGASLLWESSDLTIAVVDQSGHVVPVGAGVVTITAKAENGVYSGVTLRVYEKRQPQSFSLGTSTLYMNIGETYALPLTISPSDAEDGTIWTTSNSGIVSFISSGDGIIRAVTSGTSTVTVVSTVDASVSASLKVVVLNPNRTLVMPARRTDISGISSNLSRISSVRKSAYDELDKLVAERKISSSERTARKNVIANAFDAYSFPWMVLKTQPYWKAANSENGAKDFQPGVVYYGIPYNSQSSGERRLANVSKALSRGWWYKASSGNYYILNQAKFSSYYGSDCSAMTAICYFGINADDLADWTTATFASTSRFTTIAKTAELYPGDIIVKGYKHIVIFLYYANSEHTQIVLIEQGGDEPAINTVSTSIRNLSYYYSNGYIPRRYTPWM